MKAILSVLILVSLVGCKGQGGSSGAVALAVPSAPVVPTPTPVPFFEYPVKFSTTSEYKMIHMTALNFAGQSEVSTNVALNNGCVNGACQNTFDYPLNASNLVQTITVTLTSNPGGEPVEITLYQGVVPVEIATLTLVGASHTFVPGF